jgi:lysozyme
MEVEQDEEFQGLSPTDKIQAKQQYFESVVIPQMQDSGLPSSDVLAAKSQFMGEQPSPADIISQREDMATQQEILADKAAHPYRTAINATARDAAVAATHFGNQLLANAPRSLANTAVKGGNESELAKFLADPKSESDWGNKMAGLAGIAGGLTSPLNRLAVGAGLKGRYGQAALTGAAQGALYSPTEDFIDPKARLAQAAGGAILGPAMVGGLQGVINAPKNLRWMSNKTMSEFLRPKEKYLRYGKQPERVVADEKISAWSAEDLLGKLNIAKNKVGSQIGKEIENIQGTHDYSSAIGVIDDQIAKLNLIAPREKASVIERLQRIKQDLLRAKEVPGGGQMQDDVSNLTAKEAFDLKDRATQMTSKNPFKTDDDAVINETMRDVYRAVSRKMQSLSPELKKLDRRYSNLKSAIPSLEDRIKVADRNRFIGMGDALSGGIGGLAGAAAGSLPVGGLAGIAANKLAQTAAFKTNLSRGLGGMATGLERLYGGIGSTPPAQAVNRFFRNAPKNSMALKGLNIEDVRNPNPAPREGANINAPKNFATAEEYVASKKQIFHGTDKVFDNFDVKKSADGSIWFTDNKDKIVKGEVSATGKGQIMERFIDENKLKLGGWKETDNFSTDELIAKGYDGLKLVDEGETTYQIFNPEKLQTKSQLTAEFNAAKGKTAKLLGATALGLGMAGSAQASDNEMTKDFEGWRSKKYKDTKGIDTIGWGFNMTNPTVKKMLPYQVRIGKRELTKAEAEPIYRQLKKDAHKIALRFLQEKAFNKLSPERQGVIDDMAYNLGPKLMKFKNLRMALMKQNYPWAVKEMENSLWYGQVKNRAKKLVKIMKGG